MARTAQNKLSITELPNGRFLLSGYIEGNQIRQRGPDFAELEKIKEKMEGDARRRALAKLNQEEFVATWLTPAQLRDAEAAFRLLEGKKYSLLQCVKVAPRLIGDGMDKDALESLAEWQKQQKQEGIAFRTLERNRQTVVQFLKATGVKTIGEITAEQVREFVFGNPDYTMHTRRSRASAVHAWLNFCIKKKWLAHLPSDVDGAKLHEMAGRRRVERDRILRPAQCEALLRAAAEYRDGYLLPYIILATWCFIRSEDVQRTTYDMIHLDNKKPVVEVRARKEGTEDYVVDIPANVQPILRACMKRGWVAISPRGRKRKYAPRAAGCVPYSRHALLEVRKLAGLLTVTKADKPRAKWKIVTTSWQENILRHTGESYHYQKSDNIAFTAKQAGHSMDIAIKHYLQLPKEGEAEKFYAITLPVFGEKIGAVA